MIENKEKEIVNSLQSYLKSKNYDCPVIMANQTAPIPEYPYISYTITSPIISDNKGFCVSDDGTRYKPFTQIWSFTVQSNKDSESLNVSAVAYDWFAIVGNTYLSDNNIIVQSVGNVGNRDNLLTIEYEYRRGFDVTFLLMNIISNTEDLGNGEITEVTINNNITINKEE